MIHYAIIRNRLAWRGMLGIVLALSTALPLWAQSKQPELTGGGDSEITSPAANAPQNTDVPPTAEQMLNEMLHPTTRPEEAGTRPSQQASVQPQGHITAIKSTGILHEGSDVVDRSGRLRKRPDSLYQEFIFDNKDDEIPLAPMRVLPDLKLMSMEDAVGATRPGLRFTISGTVTEYKGANYILLESGPDDLGRPMAAPMVSRSAPTGPASADEMLSQMLKNDTTGGARPMPARLPAPSVDRSSGPGAVAPGAPLLNVLREQSEIIDRTARISHGSDERQIELVFESDGAAMQDPPLIILPNLKCAAMEGAAAVVNREPRFRVTGTVTEYRGRNYILLEKVVVLPEVNQQF